MACLKMQSRLSSGKNEEYYEKKKSDVHVTRLRFEPGTATPTVVFVIQQNIERVAQSV
jgi:hypothetical protein